MKQIYFGGCSFLEKPNIFENDVLLNHFGKDSIVINNAKSGSSNDQIFRKAIFSILKNNFDFVLIGWTQCWRIDKVLDVYENTSEYRELLMEESNSSILKTSNFYSQVVANDKMYNRFCHLEPEGTDFTIMYTTILHEILKTRNIPHLFLSMGDIMPYTLEAREGWLQLIDKKNYFGTGDLKERMSFAITNHFYNEHLKIFGESTGMTWTHKNSLIRDNASHLSDNGGRVLAEMISNHIIKNKIL